MTISKKDMITLKKDTSYAFNSVEVFYKDKTYTVVGARHSVVSGTLNHNRDVPTGIPKWLIIDGDGKRGIVHRDDAVLVKKYKPAPVRMEAIVRCECGNLIAVTLKNEYYSKVCRLCNKRTSIKREQINDAIKKRDMERE